MQVRVYPSNHSVYPHQEKSVDPIDPVVKTPAHNRHRPSIVMAASLLELTKRNQGEKS